MYEQHLTNLQGETGETETSSCKINQTRWILVFFCPFVFYSSPQTSSFSTKSRNSKSYIYIYRIFKVSSDGFLHLNDMLHWFDTCYYEVVVSLTVNKQQPFSQTDIFLNIKVLDLFYLVWCYSSSFPNKGMISSLLTEYAMILVWVQMQEKIFTCINMCTYLLMVMQA